MRKLAIALLTTTVFSVPAAMAASNQQPQDQQKNQQSQMQTPAQPQAQDQQQNKPQSSAQQNNAEQSQQNNRAANDQGISPQDLSRSDVRQVQQALDNNGINVGRVDGRWGPKTSDAVKQFQQKKNIEANGRLDQQTIQDLGLNNLGNKS